MRLRRPGLWIALLSAAAVAALVVGDLGRTSPGELAAVHAREDKLNGAWSCAQCHGGWFSSMTESCLECHAPIRGQLEQGIGLHGVLEPDAARHCAACHSDHHGEDFAMVNRQSFARAGVPDPKAFDHRLIGFPMAGRHLELACSECHPNADLAILPAGAVRFLGLQQDCASCHEDPHQGRMSRGCADCHGQQDFDQLHAVGHAQHLPLIGGHADVACRTCHAADEPHALESFSRATPPTARACLDCHESPHRVEFVGGASCATCHLAAHETFRDEELSVTPAQHAATGFALEVPHAEVACGLCHSRDGATFAARYPGRGADECHACHQDPHGGQFATGPFAGQGCLGCHERVQFEPHAFTVEKHARAALVLDGAHLESDCNACHARADEATPRAFRGTPVQCDRCHGDAHAGFFARHAAALSGGAHGQCAHCHATTSFAALPAGGYEHARWTGFAVRGAHAQVACAACHPPRLEPDAQRRTFGTVAENFGQYQGCGTCHVDPHRGMFDGAGLPRDVSGRTSCARCHGDASFRVLLRGFDHGRWTGYPLDDAHRALECVACHAAQPADQYGRTWGRAPGTQCADCHGDHDDPLRRAKGKGKGR